MPTWITKKNGAVDRVRLSGSDAAPGPEWEKVPDGWNGSPGDKLGWFDAGMRRIPDAELVESGIRKNNRGLWYSTETIGESKRIHDMDREPGEGWTREKPLAGEAYQKWDGASGRWIIDTKKKEAADLEGKIGGLKSEISSRDWKVIKAQRLGITVEDIYPGETGWYTETVNRINALETQLKSLEEQED
jgi:hypothetical protein